MGQDHGRGTINKRICKHLSRVHMASVNKADGNNTDIYNLICTVNRSTEKVFLLPVYVMPDMRDQIGGGFNADSFRADAAAGELSGSQNQGSLGIADAVKLCKIVNR